ncbi:bifunctional DNA-formamidopyrimidine glycosylase/DNA-(apurinic or apyrimidinic site) lyase [Candidatus Wolfebacteria bacterium]|nr:bifunctional DNA-formamidopyrimidine glycosylase/DNA-(apurinic or apyrimidinic site) lyase [Candidatus Wolfebacteria bacterium]
MPELPEVETIVRGLRKKIIGRRVTGVWFDVPRMIKTSPAQLRRGIKGLTIADVRRRGKYILVELTNDQPLNKTQGERPTTDNFILLIHQKMSGHLLYGKWRMKKVGGMYQVSSDIKGRLAERNNSYIHFILHLNNGRQVGLSDVRKFGTIRFGSKDKIENMAEFSGLGPEPMGKEFTASFLKSLLRGRRPIKAVLMDQGVLSGLGNLYSSEALFAARIDPRRPPDSLTKREIKRLAASIKLVLGRGIRYGGASIMNFRNADGRPGRYAGYRLVYGKNGEPCGRCAKPIEKVRIGQRTAHYCSGCQR